MVSCRDAHATLLSDTSMCSDREVQAMMESCQLSIDMSQMYRLSLPLFEDWRVQEETKRQRLIVVDAEDDEEDVDVSSGKQHNISAMLALNQPVWFVDKQVYIEYTEEFLRMWGNREMETSGSVVDVLVLVSKLRSKGFIVCCRLPRCWNVHRF